MQHVSESREVVRDFQDKQALLNGVSSLSFVRAPECSGCIEC